MTDRSVTHATFVVEHAYKAAPAKVFAAFASSDAKAQWFGAPDDAVNPNLKLDFRVGGKETTSGGMGAPVYKYEAAYQDIVTDQRIVTTYNMWTDDDLISVSVATIALRAEGDTTHLTYTEQGAFLDGKDQPSDREHGTREMLVNALPRYLERA
ncbi:MAG: SRPBCC family protein [Candidatus Eremiobacteraeota bacterium]|nr:SRPBCC family protein [Candidatus Eremiobacteraeota bacterium]